MRYGFDEGLLRDLQAAMHSKPTELISHIKPPGDDLYREDFQGDVTFPMHRVILDLRGTEPFAVLASSERHKIRRGLENMRREGVRVYWQFSIQFASGKVTASPRAEVTAAHDGVHTEPVYLEDKYLYALCNSANVPTEISLGTLSRPVRSYKPLDLPDDINRLFGTGGPPRHYGYVEDVVRARRRFANLLTDESGA